MSNTIKYLFSAVLLIIGTGILVRGQWTQGAEEPLPAVLPSVEFQPAPVELQAIEEQMDRIKAEDDFASPQILPLMVITPKVCPPCVNNMNDYANLLKDNPLFLEPTLVFVGIEKNAVERFVITTGLDLPFTVLDSRDAGTVMATLRQDILFIDLDEQMAFYNTYIPNSFMPLKSKEKELDEAASRWISLFTNEP